MSRFELATDWEYAGGTRLATIKEWDPSTTEVTEDIEGEDRLSLRTSRLDDAWEHVAEHRVVRWVDTDADPERVREWRIRDIVEQVTEDATEPVDLVCEGPIYDLGTRGELIRRTEANGEVRPHFQVNRRTPSTHMDIALGTLSPYTPAVASHFAKGTVDPTDAVDVTYNWDTVRSAIEEIRVVSRGEVEFDVRRDDGAGVFRLDLVREIGDWADVPLIKTGRDAVSVRRERSTKDQATVAYPRGGGAEGERGSIAENRFEVIGTDGVDRVRVDPGLILEDGQLNQFYLKHLPSGQVRAITGSDASTGDIHTADFSSVVVGDHVRVVADASGAQLIGLPKPSAVGTWGEIPAGPEKLDRQDIPNVNNLLDNAYLTEWPGGSPASWDVLGGASITQYTGDQFAGHGGSSAHVVADEGDGIGTQATTVEPTEDSPLFTGQMRLWMVSGSVRIRMVDVTNGKVWPPGEADTDEITDETGSWVERLGIQPGEDFFKSQTSQLQLMIVAQENGTEFYLDAGMLTQTPGGVGVFYDESGSNELWRAAQDHLAVYAEPLDTIEVTFVDLSEVDDVGYREVVKGGVARIKVPELDLDVERRVKRITWHPGEPWNTQLEIETERERLSRQLAASKRRRRQIQEQRPPQASRPDNVENFQGVFTDILILRWDASVGASRYEIRRQGFGSGPLDRWETGTLFGSTDAVNFVEDSPEEAILHLTIRAVNAWGRWSTQPTELTIVSEGSGGPCENLLTNNPAAEHCSTETNTDELIHTYPSIDLTQHGLEEGDFIAYAFEGKVSDLASGIIASEGFNEDEICQQPTGWQPAWGANEILLGAHAAGSRPALVMGEQAFGPLAAARWTELGELADGEILTLQRLGSTGGRTIGVVLRASGSDGSETGIWVGSETGRFEIQAWSNGTETGHVEHPDGNSFFNSHSWYWIRARVSGGDVDAKAWQFGTAEPSGFQLSTTTSHSTGWWGVGGGGDALCAHVAVATDAGTAGIPPEREVSLVQDFGDDTVGLKPTSIESMLREPENANVPTYETYEVIEDAAVTGGRFVREDVLEGSSGSGDLQDPHRMHRLVEVGVAIDSDVRAKVRVDDLSSETGVFARGCGGNTACATGDTFGGIVAYVTGGDQLVVESYTAANHTSPTAFEKQSSIFLPSTYATDEWVWVALQVVGVTVRAKAWVDGDAEPTDWQIEETWDISGSGDTGEDQLVKGAMGWYNRASTHLPVDLDVIEVQTGVDESGLLPVVHATLEIELLEDDGSVVQLVQPVGVATLDYSRGAGTIELPADVSALQVSSWRKGSHTASACVRRVQVNRGRIPCAFENPGTENCDNLVGSAGAPERASGSVSPGTIFFTWPRVDLEAFGLDAGDFIAWGYEGRVADPNPDDDNGVSVSVNLHFFDAAGDPVVGGLDPLGVRRSTEYVRAEHAHEIPSGAVEAEFRADRAGLEPTAEAWVRRLQVNPGRTPCAFADPTVQDPLISAAVAQITADDCAGGEGVEILVAWKAGANFTDADYDVQVRYFVDGEQIAHNKNLDPQAGEDTHTISGAGSDAGDAASHDVHAIVLIGNQETFETSQGDFTVFSVIDGIETEIVQETWGTCP